MAPARIATAALLAALPPAALPSCDAPASELARVIAAGSWRETTMTDGKPLILDIAERDGRVFIRFVKAAEGLWAEGHADICGAPAGVHARLRQDDLVLGPAANWFIRRVLRQGGARFDIARLPDGRLRVATTGWSGEFVAEAP